ncbi:HAMP domain-containing sensor histidine kinase [Sphingobacterium oryzagri]|uniref:histidine kinase n=1 Tax=Sphingobacterium oryzagri TaxID=3025669 RepID=A0ABY7WID2_9SPHI|nr:HAMP domain-containing sensor histidine kinase [Sphingobacterium sp. KACC 22765]WDF69379.1 HAMP domain-containing sensor histidine kinase [Sphingobacterium sp. KACC 22765]
MLTKIRFLLLILTLSLLGTAITIHFTITDEEMLQLDERKLTSNIHKFEDRIDEILSDSLIVKTFQNVDKYPVQLAQITDDIGKEFIFFYVYRDNQIVHWSTNIYVPVTDVGLRSNTSYLQSENRSFLVKKKELKHGISVLALVPIKRNFENPNNYLTNNFLQVIDVKNIEIAQYNDNKNIRNIYSKDNSYLFSVKLIEGKKDNIYIDLQFFCWVAAIICLIILTNSICLHFAKNGKPWLAVILFFAVLVAIRYIDLQSNWLSVHSSLELFDPKYYAYSEFLPNVWSYLMTTGSIFWFICFVKHIQKLLTVPKRIQKRGIAIALSLVSIFSIYILTQLMYYFLGTLLTHSPSYDNDFTKILNLDLYGWLCILLFCLNVTSLVLYIDGVVQMVRYFLKDVTLMLNMELICLVVSLIAYAVLQFNVFFCILFGAMVFLRTYKTYNFSTPYRLSVFISTILLLSAASVLSYNYYNRVKKTDVMKQSIAHLLAEDDVNAVSLFVDVEKNLNNDYKLEKLLSLNDSSTDIPYITEYIKTRYLSGYLSKFEFQAYYYNNEGKPLENYAGNKAAEYREKVIRNAIKIPFTTNFYRLKSELGTHEYFTHLTIPYEDNPDKFYHIYINLKNLSYSTLLPYPEILSDSKASAWQFDAFQNNSYAMYKGHNLITQYGTYNFPENDFNVPDKLREYMELKDNDNFLQLAYKPDQYTTIVLGKQKTTAWEYLALGSIIFILLLIFFSAFNLTNYLIKTVTDKSFRWSRIRYQVRMMANNIQYSTRIQTLVIMSVLMGILISGAIAFISINNQLEETTSANRLKEIAEVTKKIENSIAGSKADISQLIVQILKDMAPSSMTNFNLYDKTGKLLYSSQPRIFDLKLISEYMNPDALTKLAVLRKSEAYEQERISDFRFSAAYASIKNEEYKTVAYLNIPYYTTEKDAIANKNLLLNTILNIYTFIIILFGFIAVAVSSKITKPLDIVRQKLAETQLSNKINEPLYWERNDEIGMLIKEYNYMLIKLEESAKQLRDAEREKAWREMAKQVAHEIKNPLTPMKLGIQQLMRSYNEDDERFAERFLRISNSVIEQIDSLSKIATEFSAFAKLPETNLVKINLIEKILKVMNLFNSSASTVVILNNETNDRAIYILGDRDQMLRSFNNLFKNAIEASVGRKKTKINVEVSYKDDDYVQILIQDNGYGISDDVIPNIFKPNFTTKSSGTGLGLAFVKQTVTGIGGKIEFITKANTGTTFIITLPIYRD